MCTAPHNEVCSFHMLMLLLTARRAAQGEKQSWSEKQDWEHTSLWFTHAAGMLNVTVDPNELPVVMMNFKTQWRGK